MITTPDQAKQFLRSLGLKNEQYWEEKFPDFKENRSASFEELSDRDQAILLTKHPKLLLGVEKDLMLGVKLSIDTLDTISGNSSWCGESYFGLISNRSVEGFLKHGLKFNLFNKYTLRHPSFRHEDITVLNKMGAKLGIDVRKLIHNCKFWRPIPVNTAKYRHRFARAVKRAKTITELFARNTPEFRDIPGMESVLRIDGGAIPWFGRENFPKYQRLFLRRLSELAINVSYTELKPLLSPYLEPNYRWSENRWLLDKSSRLPMRRILLRSAKSFEEAKDYLGKVDDGTLAKEALEKMSSVAVTERDHYLVATLAFDGNHLQMWKKHVLLCAAALSKREKR